MYDSFSRRINYLRLAVTDLAIGDCLCIGEQVILEVTQIGKKCHNKGCVIKKKTGDCIMPREGLFCKVINGGELMAGSNCSLCGHGQDTCIANL